MTRKSTCQDRGRNYRAIHCALTEAYLISKAEKIAAQPDKHARHEMQSERFRLHGE